MKNILDFNFWTFRLHFRLTFGKRINEDRSVLFYKQHLKNCKFVIMLLKIIRVSIIWKLITSILLFLLINLDYLVNLKLISYKNLKIE